MALETLSEGWAIRTEDVTRHDTAGRKLQADTLAVEEPLEIRLAGCPVTVTMRTPGDDFDLALGFLFSEGIISGMKDVASVAWCETDDRESAGNIVNVNTQSHAVDLTRLQRNFYATSSCGVCGKASIASVRTAHSRIEAHARIGVDALFRMPGRLREAQPVFGRTGGMHAAAIFDLEGNLVLAREDIGRHNAVDKVIGAMVREDRVPLSNHVLFVSSRASFEIVQKALAARIPIVAAVSAASSLAVDLARASGMTLAGFLRDKERSFNLYASPERITIEAQESDVSQTDKLSIELK